jgi:hypothetical protein
VCIVHDTRLGNWFVLWLTIQFWKYFSEEVRTGEVRGRRAEAAEPTPTFLSSRILFFVFIIHTFWEVPPHFLPPGSGSLRTWVCQRLRGDSD